MVCQGPLVGASANYHCLERLISTLQGAVYRNVPGYDAKYFPKSFQETAQSISASEAQPQNSIPLQSPSELLKWLDDLPCRRLGATHNSFVLHSIKRKPRDISGTDICLVRTSASKLQALCPDAAVLVLGLFQTGIEFSPGDEAVLGFCDLAMSVFAARPDRRFLHAFRIYNSTMETWTFDRAGAYSGELFNIVEEPDRFRNIVAGYMSMDDDRLGLNSFLQQDDQGAFLELKEQNQPSVRRLYVDEDAFVRQDYLVGPGTTCFKARIPALRGQEMVVKFAWNRNEGSAERRLLQFANEKNIWGILKLEGYQDLGDIACLRQGLRFGRPYEFSLHLETKESDNFQNLPGSTPKSPLLRQVSSGIVEHGKEFQFDNLKFECIVTSPLGRPLSTFSSPSELMTVLRDIIKALRSLYVKANILHRDVSPQNIIIAPNNNQDPGAPIGMLIDLDLALDLSNLPSERRLVGSEGFMAIGILGGDDHTYRHDLESVFYVFLWMAICRNGVTPDNIPNTSRLHLWCGTDFLASFHSKRKDMQLTEFSKLAEEEFTEHFKPYLPLAMTIHQLLFPVRNGKIFIGTDHEPGSIEQLYVGMIAGFERYIS
ncbi:hypothetical protein MauCBS54593_000039 [Microsporum audouinii]